jgi:hypothetical protein
MLSDIIYCENIPNALFSQPINLISNLAFLIVAIILFIELKKKKKLTLQLNILITLIGLVSIGSILWHLYPNNVTIYFDVLPIAIFS